jgi:Protein of unknown function (DUF3072)
VQDAGYCLINETKSNTRETKYMTDKLTQEHADESNTIKDPEDWTTGDEPMTGAQRSYLSTLSEEAKEEFDENLTKAEASKRIEELQQKTGRGATN